MIWWHPLVSSLRFPSKIFCEIFLTNYFHRLIGFKKSRVSKREYSEKFALSTIFLLISEAYSEPCQTPKMELSEKIVNRFNFHKELHLRRLTGFWICPWIFPKTDWFTKVARKTLNLVCLHRPYITVCLGRPYSSNFLKAVSHKFYLVHSWIPCPINYRSINSAKFVYMLLWKPFSFLDTLI